MGNFFVDGIAGTAATKCGNLLVDIARGESSFTMPSIFSTTKAYFNLPEYRAQTAKNFFYALEEDISSHPFLNNSFGNLKTDEIVDLFPSIADLPDIIRKPVEKIVPKQVRTKAKVTGKKVVKKIKETIDTGVSTVSGFISGLFNKLISFATSFIGKINNDRQGNAMFSGGRAQAWCADFVTYCVRKVFGNRIPSDFGSSAVSELRAWGNKHRCYRKAPSNLSDVSTMQNYIKKHVKPGDIMIQKRNGRSHTGIVKSVASDGSTYTVVEGNSSDKVQTVTYKATNKYLDGFISLAQFA